MYTFAVIVPALIYFCTVSVKVTWVHFLSPNLYMIYVAESIHEMEIYLFI